MIEGLVEDVSRSGLFMRAPRRMTIAPGPAALATIGWTTELDLDLPGEPTLHLPAEVVRVDDAGMAFRFIADPHAKLPLANFIMKQHATVVR